MVRRPKDVAWEAWESFEAYREVLYARYRAGRDISAREAAELRHRWEAAWRYYHEYSVPAPSSWEQLAADLGLQPHDAPLPEHAPRGLRGPDRKAVSRDEANRAARIWARNGRPSELTVWRRYNPRNIKQTQNPELLSKRMIGHLVAALEDGLLVYDADADCARGPDETRVETRGKFFIPRRGSGS
jgi:hypothetical protein